VYSCSEKEIRAGFDLSDRAIPLLVRFPAQQDFLEVVDLERGPLSLVSIIEKLLEWKSSGSGSREPRLTAVGIRYVDHATTAKVGTDFADKRRSLGRYSSLALLRCLVIY
jgi:hypothetical protein